MKKVIIFLFGAIAVFAACESNSQDSVAGKNAEFHVRGNCVMCQERIEQTAVSVEGVKKAEWDVKTSLMKVVFDSTKTESLAIQKAIAATGHGTEQVQMNQTAHDQLPDCCKVKAKKEGSADSHKNHNH